MTRFTAKEKVELRRAMVPAATIPTIGFGRIAAIAKLLGESLRQARLRARLATELSGLSDRVLADIGVSRGEIDRVADRAAGGAHVRARLAAELRALAADMRQRIVRRVRRRETHRALMALDDRTLVDIGIDRADIPVIAEMSARIVARSETDKTEGGLAELLRPLRHWSTSRAAARTLKALDDRTLSDIGILRAEIDSIAWELAGRSTRRPANRNEKPRAA